MFTLIDPNERKCANCIFSTVERPNPQLLQSVRMCRYGPPAVILVPTAATQATTMRTFPVVQDADWCHRFEPLAPPAN